MRTTRVTGIEVVERAEGEVVLRFKAGRRSYPLRLDAALVAGLESTLQGLRAVNERESAFVQNPWDRDAWLREQRGLPQCEPDFEAFGVGETA